VKFLRTLLFLPFVRELSAGAGAYSLERELRTSRRFSNSSKARIQSKMVLMTGGTFFCFSLRQARSNGQPLIPAALVQRNRVVTTKAGAPIPLEW